MLGKRDLKFKISFATPAMMCVHLLLLCCRRYTQVHEVLSIENYLQNYFEADARVQEAEQLVVDMMAGETSDPGFENIPAAEAWRDRVIKWRENLRNDLEKDSVPAPGGTGHWLLWPRVCIIDDTTGAIKCSLCPGCMTAIKKKDATGKPRAEMPDCARAHGLWGGPEPQEIRDLTVIERRVIQLARVYAMVKRVLGKHVPWAKDHEAAIPQYTSHNVVAYPHDPGKLMRIVCMLPEDLAKDFAVQFLGTLEDVRQEPALKVNLQRLRSAIWWLATNCWPWMEQTKYLSVRAKDKLGLHLEGVLAKYSESLEGSEEAVPRELALVATRIDSASIPQAREGPADAADSSVDIANRGEYSSAVIDTGLESLQGMQLAHMAVKQLKIVEENSAIIAALGPEDDSDEKEAAVRAEAIAKAEAAQVLSRLGAKEVREELQRNVDEENDTTASVSLQLQGASVPKSAGSRVRAELKSFVQQSAGEQLVLRLKHAPQLLSSFDEYFWCHGFVDLFFRGDCIEKYPSSRKPLSAKKWIKIPFGAKIQKRSVAILTYPELGFDCDLHFEWLARFKSP